MRQQGSLIISYIRVYETRCFFSSTSSQIYDKEKQEQVKAIIFHRLFMEPNTLLFDPVKPKICHDMRVRTYK